MLINVFAVILNLIEESNIFFLNLFMVVFYKLFNLFFKNIFFNK